jgi:hypothetical protein
MDLDALTPEERQVLVLVKMLIEQWKKIEGDRMKHYADKELDVYRRFAGRAEAKVEALESVVDLMYRRTHRLFKP